MQVLLPFVWQKTGVIRPRRLSGGLSERRSSERSFGAFLKFDERREAKGCARGVVSEKVYEAGVRAAYLWVIRLGNARLGR